jgi:hypothetical protein
MSAPRSRTSAALLTARLARIGLVFAALWLAACGPVGVGGGPAIDPSAPVPVALLVPSGTGQASDDVLAANLENATRMAIGDLAGVSIDLRVYSSGATAAQAAAAASKAVDEGAKIILGPVFAEAANAAGRAVAGRGVNVLSFSNNTAIAGGNVFVLGNLFDNTADRLVRYSVGQGRRNILVVHGNSAAETIGRDAIVRAIQSSGGALAGTVGFELSQQGAVAALPQVAAEARSSGATALFLTSGTDGALPLLAQLLPDQGLGPSAMQYIGLQRWDIPANARELPGLQGGWIGATASLTGTRRSAWSAGAMTTAKSSGGWRVHSVSRRHPSSIACSAVRTSPIWTPNALMASNWAGATAPPATHWS